MQCAEHPSSESTAYCANCGRALCPLCRRDVHGAAYCENCLAIRLRQSGIGSNPGVALILGFIPGVGAVYNGQHLKAIIQVLVFAALIALSNAMKGAFSPLSGVFGLGIAVFYFYMIIDSYKVAKAQRAGEPAPEWPGISGVQIKAPAGATILIALGILLLLENLGVPVIGEIGRFWPVLLILLGILIIRRRALEMRDSGPGPQGSDE